MKSEEISKTSITSNVTGKLTQKKPKKLLCIISTLLAFSVFSMQPGAEPADSNSARLSMTLREPVDSISALSPQKDDNPFLAMAYRHYREYVETLNGEYGRESVEQHDSAWAATVVGQMYEVRRYVDKALEWLNTDRNVGRAHNIGLWQKYYQTFMLYFRAMGDHANAWLYSDSLEIAKKIAEEEFNLQKLHNAEHQIMQEELDNILEISEKTGFGTIRSFQRQFQTKYNMTPNDYRKSCLLMQRQVEV